MRQGVSILSYLKFLHLIPDPSTACSPLPSRSLPLLLPSPLVLPSPLLSFLLYCSLYNCVLAIFRLSVVANIDIKACSRDCVTVERNKNNGHESCPLLRMDLLSGRDPPTPPIHYMREITKSTAFTAPFRKQSGSRQFAAGAIRGKSVREGSDLPPRRAALPLHFRVFLPDRRA